MRIKLTVATALAATLLATCLVSGSAQATSVPVLKSDAGMATLVRKGGGGGGHGGFKGLGGFKGGHIGRGGGKHYAFKGGGKHYGYKGGGKHYGYKGGSKHYAYKGRDHGYHDGHKRYGHYGKYRRYGYYGWYRAPFLAYGYYGGGCGWLYRNAVATGDPYWWNRYYECVGYY